MSFEAYIPLLAPFIIGLLVGVVIKKGLKLILAVIALIIALVATGYLSIGFSEVRDRAMDYLPRILGEARNEFQILPYSSAAFLIGIALGLWKG